MIRVLIIAFAWIVGGIATIIVLDLMALAIFGLLSLIL